MKHANILGVCVTPLRLEDVLRLICAAVSARRRLLVTHVNVRGLNLAYEQAWFRQFLNSSDLVYCDGMGVILGGRILGYPIPQRFTLADWVYPLAELCEKGSYGLFLLGNPPGISEKAACRLKERYPELKVAGTCHGYFDKSAGCDDNEGVVAQINAAQPDILMVGFGMPDQEKWLMENWERLDVRVAIACGALFEYISGDLPRGPRWMTDHYLEWLARFFISPGRYWKRYLLDDPRFIYRVLKQKITGVTFPETKNCS